MSIFLEALVINFIFYLFVFIIGKLKGKHDIIDIFWGLSFVNLAFWFYIQSAQTTVHKLLLLVVFAWGLRLSIHLLRRNWNKPEDKRYVAIQTKLTTNFKRIPLLIKEFIYIYCMQMVFSLIIGFSFISAFTSTNPTYIVLAVIGLLIFLIGYLFEVIGDYQLNQYMRTKPTSVLNTGLWKYTRHPNYFGEVVIWYGIFLISFAISHNPFSLISPLLINFLIVKLSGVPMLEKTMMKREAYQEYAKVTSKFWPTLPKGEK
ncbi:MAG: DUF1295 domain-containing protein [Mycoplasmatales bacterium]